VRLRQHDGYRLTPNRQVGALADSLRAERDGDVDLARKQRLWHLRVPHLFCTQLDVRVVGPKRLPELRQDFETRAPAEGHRQPAELSRRGALRVGFGVLELGQRPSRPIEKGLAGVRELHLARGAQKQVGPKLLLELADGDAERWLRHVQSLGGAAEVELLCDRDEVAQMAKLEHRKIDRTRGHSQSV
jgi:hypothetical protein